MVVPGRGGRSVGGQAHAQAITSGGGAGAMAARGGRAVLRKDANPSAAILVSKRRQTGNPLLRFIKNVRWQYVEDLVPDYQMGKSTVALFLSLKYHLLHPQYIHFRIRELQVRQHSICPLNSTRLPPPPPLLLLSLSLSLPRFLPEMPSVRGPSLRPVGEPRDPPNSAD